MEFNVRRALRPGRSFFSGMWTLLAGIAVLACSAGSGSFAMDGGIDDAQAVDDGAIDGAIPDSPFQSGGDSAARVAPTLASASSMATFEIPCVALSPSTSSACWCLCDTNEPVSPPSNRREPRSRQGNGRGTSAHLRERQRGLAVESVEPQRR